MPISSNDINLVLSNTVRFNIFLSLVDHNCSMWWNWFLLNQCTGRGSSGKRKKCGSLSTECVERTLLKKTVPVHISL